MDDNNFFVKNHSSVSDSFPCCSSVNLLCTPCFIAFTNASNTPGDELVTERRENVDGNVSQPKEPL